MKAKDIFQDIHSGGADVVAASGLPMPLIIAEAGVNHEGSMETARRRPGV